MEGFKVLLAMCFLMSTASVQGISNSGNEFNLIFPPNLAAASAEFPPILYVTTDEDGPVQFTVSYSRSRPPVSDMSTHTARKKNLTRVELPFQLITSFTQVCIDCGITLKAEEGKNIIVYALNEGGASTDVYLGLPYFETKTETYDYYGVSVPRSSLEPKPTNGYMAMVVQEAGTVITLTPTVQIEGFLSGAGLRFQPGRSYSSSPLAKGFTVLLRATEDLTGSKISSNKPITFITGHQCGFLPSNETACDHLTEQLPPAETFGFKFVLVPLLLREQDGYRIVASRDGTTVNLNCVDMSGSSVQKDSFSLNEGKFRQLFLHSDRFCTLEADLPIVVVQIALGHSFDGVNPADPFMVMIPPLGQYRNDHSLIFAESFSINSRDDPVVFKPYLSLSVPSECCNRGQIEFDDGTIPWNIFVDVKCENGEICACAAQYEVPSAQSRGGHSLQHSISECIVGVIVYAYEKENSYGYPGGMNVDSIAVPNYCFKDEEATGSEPSGVLRFTIENTGTPEAACITFTTSDGTANAGTDFVVENNTCCFGAGQREAVCEIKINQDSDAEGEEDFTVSIVPEDGQCVCNKSLTCKIIDDPVVVVEFNQTTYTVDEDAGFACITVVLDIPAPVNFTVQVSFTDGTATASEDYISTPVVATFAKGASSATIKVPIIKIDDNQFECDEDFQAAISVPGDITGAKVTKGTKDEAQVTIWDKGNKIKFKNETYMTEESVGNFTEVCLVADQPFAKDTNVSISFEDINATGGPNISVPGVDYGNGTVVVTFKGGSSFSSYASIPIAPDDDDEGDEQFKATFEVPGGYRNLTKGEPEEAVITIKDVVTGNAIRFEKESYRTTESVGIFTGVRLVADQPFAENISVNISFEDISATGGVDYGSGSVVVTFENGSRFSTNASIPIIPDNDTNETDEQFRATFELPGGYRNLNKGEPEEAVITIENVVTEIIVEFNQTKYNVSEGDGFVLLTLVSSTPIDTEYTVEVFTQDETAEAGDDYLSMAPFSATFAPGETSATVLIPIRDDSVLEQLESFFAGLSIPGPAASLGVKAGARENATVYIDDDDSIEVVFDPISYNVSESDGEVTLILRANSTASFDYTVRVDTSDISATGGRDYTSGGYEVIFLNGSSTAQLTVNITNDDITECAETFTANLSIPPEVSTGGIFRGANNVATVSIIDNDPAEINFVPIEYTVQETGDKVNLNLKSSKVLGFDCSLSVSTSDGTAQESLDYSGLDEEMFTIPADDDSVVVMVTLFDDNVFDCTTQNFSVNFVVSGECAACGVSVGDGMATVNIEDNDMITVQFRRTTYSVEEGNVTVDLEVIVDKEFECQFNVPVNTEDGNATVAEGDYVAGGYLARFMPGSQTSTVSVDIRDDSEQEGDEYFRARLSLPEDLQNQTVLLGPIDTANVVIVDEGVVRVRFAPDMYSITEGDGFVTITLESSGPADQDYIVNVKTSDRSATSPEDYTGDTYQVTFEAGKTTAQFNVSINDDNVCEREEMFVVMLEIPAESNMFGIMAGMPSEATVTILDDDVVEVQFNPKYYVVNESDGEVTLTLDCGPCAHSYDVSLECSEGTAQEFLDYSVPSPLVTMCSPGSNKSFVDISITDNILNEPTENFTCRITDVPEGVTPGPDDEATVDIIDNDRVLVVNFNPVEYSVVESDGSVTLTVVASAPSSEQYSVFVDTSDGSDPSATGGDDYREGPYEVVFPPGITSATVTIGITRDSDCECDEVFVGMLRVPDGSDVSVGTNDTATITIKNDDECQLVFDPPSYMVNETVGSVEVCVKMEENCVGAFDLPLNTADGPNEDRRAVVVNDYEAGPYTISFAEGQTRACTDIPIVDDDVHEPKQDFTVSMEVPSGLPLRPGENATVTITDDDRFRCMIGEGSIVVLESDGVITLDITIDREIEEPVMCAVSTQPGTAKDDTDFKPILEVITFEPQGRRTQPVRLNITDDDKSEPVEDLKIEITSFDLQEERTNEPAAAINVTIIDDDTRCLISEGGLLRTFLNESMYRFTNMCPFELISTCPQGGEEPIPFQIHIDTVNGNLNSTKVAIEYEASTVVIAEDGRVTRIGSDITVSERGGRIIARVEALDVTVTRTFGDAGQISVSVSNSSDLLSQLCGLCGNSEGVLSFKDQTVASPDNMEQLSRFFEEYRVPRTEQIFSELSSACVGEPQVRNDTVIGDPLYEVPLRLSSELMQEYGEISLCYEVHGRANVVFNLISDVCVSVNAHYTPMNSPAQGNIINQIGILAEDSSGQCQRIEVNLTGCAASVNGVGVTNYDQDGIHVIRRSQSQRLPRVRVSVPNCDNHELVMWVVCEQRQGQPMIMFVVARGHNLSPTSHGLIGQFWNIDVSAEKYTVTESDVIDPKDTHFAVTVRPPNGDARRFFADIHHKTWNKDNKYCLYAGDGQGGRVFEVPSLPDPVIEGRYFNYQMRGLFATRYPYSRFTADCNPEDTV